MEWVTIRNYELPYQAYFDRDLLEDNGIQTAIQDELLAQVYWLYTAAIDGIKLQVRKEDVQISLELLNQENDAPLEVAHTLKKPMYKIKCPRCSSNHVYKDEKPNIFYFLTYLIFLVPIPINDGTYHCYYCENTWKI